MKLTRLSAESAFRFSFNEALFISPPLPALFYILNLQKRLSPSGTCRRGVRSLKTDIQQRHSLGLIPVHYTKQNLLLPFAEHLVMWPQ